MSNNTKPANNKPAMNAYLVNESKGDNFWTKVGVLFPHDDGKGYNLVLTPGLSVTGRVVIRERKPDDAQADD
jgi:hypothetical protein